MQEVLSMSPDQLEIFINNLIAVGKSEEFYWCYAWKKKSAEVIRRNHRECLYCKARGKLTIAKQVHHKYPKNQYPRWALSEFVTLPDGTVERNLYPTCEECHIEQEGQRKKKIVRGFTNAERW